MKIWVCNPFESIGAEQLVQLGLEGSAGDRFRETAAQQRRRPGQSRGQAQMVRQSRFQGCGQSRGSEDTGYGA